MFFYFSIFPPNKANTNTTIFTHEIKHTRIPKNYISDNILNYNRKRIIEENYTVATLTLTPTPTRKTLLFCWSLLSNQNPYETELNVIHYLSRQQEST